MLEDASIPSGVAGGGLHCTEFFVNKTCSTVKKAFDQTTPGAAPPSPPKIGKNDFLARNTKIKFATPSGRRIFLSAPP
jgi:hypothetical protein